MFTTNDNNYSNSNSGEVEAAVAAVPPKIKVQLTPAFQHPDASQATEHQEE